MSTSKYVLNSVIMNTYLISGIRLNLKQRTQNKHLQNKLQICQLNFILTCQMTFLTVQ